MICDCGQARTPPPPKQLNTLWRWCRRGRRREQNSRQLEFHTLPWSSARGSPVRELGLCCCPFTSRNQPDAVSCRRTGKKVQKPRDKNLLLFKEKYEAGDYMHPQRSTQGPQPLGGIITVIAGLALQIVFTNFLLSLKITFKFSRNGTCANFVR